jgi:type I restriction enzyme, S subunit
VTVVDVCIVRPEKNRADARYLAWAINSPLFRRGIDKFINGTTRQRISRTNLEQVSVPLPSLREQQRIARILDAAYSLRLRRGAALVKLDQLAQSIFSEMFGDPVLNPKSWKLCKLEEVIDPARPLTYGILMPGDDQEDGIKYVRVIDMKGGTIDLGGIRKTTAEIANQYRRSTLSEGDILLSIRGHVGRLAIVPKELSGANITQDTARIAVESFDPYFVQEMLRTQGLQRWMSKRTKGAAVKGINLGDVRQIPLLAPPIEVQREFGRMVIGIQRTSEAMKKEQRSLAALFDSLEHRAFRGEL